MAVGHRSVLLLPKARGTLLADSCPECSSSIHGSPQGLLLERTEPSRLGAGQIQLERCVACGFDFRRLTPTQAPEPLLEYEAADQDQIAAAGQGTEPSNNTQYYPSPDHASINEEPGVGVRSACCSPSGVARINIPYLMSQPRHCAVRGGDVIFKGCDLTRSTLALPRMAHSFHRVVERKPKYSIRLSIATR